MHRPKSKNEHGNLTFILDPHMQNRHLLDKESAQIPMHALITNFLELNGFAHLLKN